MWYDILIKQTKKGTTMTDMRDTGISTIKTSFFNTDHAEHDQITAEEARKVFDFRVAKEQDYRQNGTAIPGHFHLVRYDNSIPNDEGIVIGAAGVGSEFDVSAQPSDAVDFIIDNILPAVPNLKIETAATINNGATSFFNLVYGDNFDIPTDNSPHETRILYINPLTLGSTKLLSHSVRIVCMNTLRMAEHTGTGFKVAHTINSKHYVRAALEAIDQELKQLDTLKERSFALANCQITKSKAIKILDELMPLKNDEAKGRMAKTRDAILNQFETDSTFTEHNAWSFLNAITFVNCHPNLTEKRTGAKVELDSINGFIASKNAAALEAVWKNTMAMAA